MPESIVHVFEMVEVHDQQGKAHLGVRRILDRHVEPLAQENAIGQIGQRVARRLSAKNVLEMLAPANIAHAQDEALVIAYPHFADRDVNGKKLTMTSSPNRLGSGEHADHRIERPDRVGKGLALAITGTGPAHEYPHPAPA